jgi:hypothetical protein
LCGGSNNRGILGFNRHETEFWRSKMIGWLVVRGPLFVAIEQRPVVAHGGSDCSSLWLGAGGSGSEFLLYRCYCVVIISRKGTQGDSFLWVMSGAAPVCTAGAKGPRRRRRLPQVIGAQKHACSIHIYTIFASCSFWPAADERLERSFRADSWFCLSSPVSSYLLKTFLNSGQASTAFGGYSEGSVRAG